jgi:DNA-binding response OmpR family regulator
MNQILIITRDSDRFSDLVRELSTQDKFQISWADSLQSALDALGRSTCEVVIIDEKVDALSWYEIASQIVSKNAMINLAVVSSLTPKKFHAASEGLGIMAQLTTAPSKAEARHLLDTFTKITSF